MASLQNSQTQYHHYIPQFILRNFSHQYNPPHSNSKKASRRRKNKKTKLYPGDPVINIIDLKDEVPQLSESPVKRIFGLTDMYRDISNASDYNFLEKEIGRIESQVSSIIADIKKAFEGGMTGFSMSRSQRDLLRKFLFIMKYRGPGFYRRFHGDESGEYNEDDAVQFKLYMQERGYRKPVDVWFKSIKTILDLKLDLEGRWKKELPLRIYPDDARWFIAHMEWYFLAFCTPSDPSDEFILTENCYNVHEGPNSTALNFKTGEYEVVSWTSYHEFSPVTPRLMLILRSALLPQEEEDANENIKTWRSNMYELNRSFHTDPAAAKSILEDLPLKKPQNSYTEILPHGIQLLPGEDGSLRSNHRFTFPFFKINPIQVQRVNCILFDNARLTSAIGFNSEASLKRSLEYYLQLPAHRGFKLVYRQENDPQLTYLKKLEVVTKTLGSVVSMVYTEVPSTNDVEVLSEESLERLRKVMLESLPEQPTEYMQLYNILEPGGNPNTLFADLEQVKKMRFFRIKIDVTTQGLHERMREKVRNNLRDLFCQLPSRRLWMYLKTLRAMSLGTPETFLELLASDKVMYGPEDVIVKGLNPSSNFTFDKTGLDRLGKITQLAFSSVGSIRDCGIKRIQDTAIPISNMLRMTKAYEQFSNPMWTVDQNIEILTRVSVRNDMFSILSEELREDVVEELSDVLFNIVYPTYIKGQND
ncbi:hypothetical protein N0V90_011131 [Kalmusia sp. IMI 367209]|nr:hypothetical protein N0V90_011131 [Kalmusia sp. IMI 367209]